VKITFDPEKRRTTLRDRGLDFSDASIVFAGLTITVEDGRRDYVKSASRQSGFSPGEW
jgi:uncharacterized DUF497 family protein